jgi:hypothetical protein
MKTKILAAVALVTTSFTPLALPGMVSVAVASPTQAQCAAAPNATELPNHNWTYETTPVSSGGGTSYFFSNVTRSNNHGGRYIWADVRSEGPPSVYSCTPTNRGGNTSEEHVSFEVIIGGESTNLGNVLICHQDGGDTAPTPTGASYGVLASDCSLYRTTAATGPNY